MVRMISREREIAFFDMVLRAGMILFGYGKDVGIYSYVDNVWDMAARR